MQNRAHAFWFNRIDLVHYCVEFGYYQNYHVLGFDVVCSSRLLFVPKDRGNRVPRNVGIHVLNYALPHLRRPCYCFYLLRKIYIFQYTSLHQIQFPFFLIQMHLFASFLRIENRFMVRKRTFENIWK